MQAGFFEGGYHNMIKNSKNWKISEKIGKNQEKSGKFQKNRKIFEKIQKIGDFFAELRKN